MTSSDDFADERPGPDGGGEPAPVIRDKRRIDPETGQVRRPAGGGQPTGQPDESGTGGPAADGAAPGPEVSPADAEALDGAAAALAEERLADLQRLQAEYVNYRKRVERDRNVARDQAIATLVEALLPVLDDIELARQHGDLEEGPFGAVADKLEAALGRFGVLRYGAVGDEFDPMVHDALLHATSADVQVETVSQVLQPGYKVHDKVLRPARVGVNSPE